MLTISVAPGEVKVRYTLWAAAHKQQHPQFRTRGCRCQLRENTEQDVKQGERLFTRGTQPGTGCEVVLWRRAEEVRIVLIYELFL